MELNEAPVGQEEFSENNETIEEPQAEQNEEGSASMEALLEEEGVGLEFPKQGEIRTGVIASLGENEILVSIGTKSEGVIPSRELEHIPEEVQAEFVVGSEILVFVVNPEDQSGGVLLSYTRAMEEQDWKLAEELLESGETYEGEVIGFNKGGLLVPMGQLRGFVPGSQISVLRRFDASGSTPEQRWGTLIGENLIMRVIEVDRERRRLILSERAALQETRETLKDRLLIELNEGDVRTGRVTSLADFGAFVNIDGADGLVHLSELSWERIDHPREVLKVGEEVEVKIIGVDQDRKRIGLSMRQLQPDPWMKKVEGIREGQLVEGTITHLTKFGAFASLGEDLEGLIHISEISEQRVEHPKEVLREGEVVTLRVIKIEPERRRIGLSLRKVDSPAYTDLDWKTTLAEIVEGESADSEGPTETDAAAEALGEALAVAEAAEAVEEAADAVEGEALAQASEAAESLEEALEVAEAAEDIEEIAAQVEEEAVVEAAVAAEALEEALEVAEAAEAVEEIAAQVEEEAIVEAAAAAEALEEAVEVAEAADVVEEVAEAVESEALADAAEAAEALEEAIEVAEAAEEVEEMAEAVEEDALAQATEAAEGLEEAEDSSEAAEAAEALEDALKTAETAEEIEEMAEEVQAEALADAAEAAEALEEAIEVAVAAEEIEELAEAVEEEALEDAAEAAEALEEAIEVAEAAEVVEEVAEAVEGEALAQAAEAAEALDEAIQVAEAAEEIEELADAVEGEALEEAAEAAEALEEAIEVAEAAEEIEELADAVEGEALEEAAEAAEALEEAIEVAEEAEVVEEEAADAEASES